MKFFRNLLYFLLSLTLFSSLFLSFVSNSILDKRFYTEDMLDKVYPVLIEEVSETISIREPFFSKYFSKQNLNALLITAFPQTEIEEIVFSIVSSFERHIKHPVAAEILSFSVVPLKQKFQDTLHTFLISFVKSLPVCTTNKTVLDFTCNPFLDTSDDAILTQITTNIDVAAIIRAVPDSFSFQIPAIGLPSSLINNWMHIQVAIIAFPYIMIVCLALIETKNMRRFWKKLASITLGTTIPFILLYFGVSGSLSYVQYLIEQSTSTGKVYIDEIVHVFGILIQQRMFFLLGGIILFSLICYGIVFFFYPLNRKKR